MEDGVARRRGSGTPTKERRRRSVWLGVVVGAVATAVVFATILAVGNLTRDTSQTRTTDAITYTAKSGSLERLLHFGMTVSWPVAATVHAGTSGTVTFRPSDAVRVVTEGTTLLTINLVPVIAVTGSVPFFRSLSLPPPGGVAISGPDVTQWQVFLSRTGGRVKTSGTFDLQTAAATKEWQAHQGIPTSGSLDTGQVVAFPTLPATVRLDLAVQVGVQVQTGQRLADVLADEPVNEIALGASPGQVQQGMAVQLASEAAASGIVTAVSQTDAISGGSLPSPGAAVASSGGAGNSYVARVEASNGGPLCRGDCATVAFEKPAIVAVNVVVLKKIEGIMLPASAIRSKPGGEAAVLLPSGVERPVIVVGQGDGMVIVTGVQDGETLLLTGPPNG